MKWMKELENLERLGPYEKTNKEKKETTTTPKEETIDTIYQEIEQTMYSIKQIKLLEEVGENIDEAKTIIINYMEKLLKTAKEKYNVQSEEIEKIWNEFQSVINDKRENNSKKTH